MVKKSVRSSTGATICACLAAFFFIAVGAVINRHAAAQSETTTFYRAINLNGRALTIDGRNWEAGSTGDYTVGSGSARFCNQSVALTPTTDAARAEMLRCSVWNQSGSSVTLTNVPAAAYDVYLYVWEDNWEQVYSVQVNGEYKQMNYSSGAAGQWARLGPWRTNATNGKIEVKATGGEANFSGIEVYRVNTGTVAPNPSPSNALVKAVNVNGAAVTIDGTAFQAEATSGMTVTGGSRFENQAAQLTPATDAARLQMIRSSVWNSSGTMTANLPVANGTYQVYLYTWEDNAPMNFELAVEGAAQGGVQSTGAANTWKRLGPYTATVQDGSLTITATGGHFMLSGVEVYAASGTTPTPAPTVTPTPTNTVDVKSYGAKGDGKTDDTQALKSIGNAGGKNIYFSPGVYLVSEPIVMSGLKDNQMIFGSNATIKAAPNWVKQANNEGILTVADSRDALVRSLTVQGFYNPAIGYNNSSYRQEALSIRNSTNIVVENVTTRDAQSGGIVGNWDTNLIVRNSKALNVFGTGMGCGNCTNTTFSNNEVVGTADPNANVMNTNAGLGLFVQKGTGAVIENNVIRNWYDTATKTEGTSNVIYRGNVVDTFGKDGIKVMFLPADQGGTNQPVYNAVIENNTVRNFKDWQGYGSGGFLLQGVTGGRVTNNTFYGPGLSIGSNGITLSSYNPNIPQNSQIVVEDNTIYDSEKGMLIDTTDATFARRNKFLSSNGARNTRNCVDVQRGDGTVLENNLCEAFTDFGFLLYDGRVDNVTIQGNAFKNGRTGVWLNPNTSTGVRILNNNFQTITYPLSYQGTVAQCAGNTGDGVRPECR